MDTPSGLFLRRRWVRWGLYLGFWTSLGLFNAGQSYFYSIYFERPFSLAGAIIIGLSDWYLWALFAPLIAVISRHFPFQPRTWPVVLFAHVAINLEMAFFIVLVTVPLLLLFPRDLDRPLTFEEMLRLHFISYVVWYFWVYWSIVGFVHALDYYRKFRERERQAAQLEARLAQAQLQVLKMQLHPHFLFNTLNAISALLHKDVEVADHMIARLGELLRSSLENVGTQEVTLQQELDFIRPYLEIEQARFGARLKVRMDIDPETMDASVPNLMLQPLVENAIRHGIAPQTGPGRIIIRSWRVGEELHLEVEDNGPGLSPEQQAQFKPGVGLANTRARLQQLYGAAHHFELRNGMPNGCTAAVVLPFREGRDAPTERVEADPDETAILTKKSALSAN